MTKKLSDDALKRGNISKRFSMSSRRAKGNIARDCFAFDQAMQGHDCTKVREGGDFVVQKRDFFGNPVGEPQFLKSRQATLHCLRRSKKDRGTWDEGATK